MSAAGIVAPPGTSPKSTIPFAVAVAMINQIPTRISAMPDQKE
eukprot:CAMPEP_0197274362 /NCGR_PEP_ID=MMETSP1432-20130617/12577_1 /TAXON_ID=44447 /ORGANISM="Pseudo-nitzschia delicatissima, Strain UNC1205" /LENGTH=42 /DNA_ID= /DNA_START= /DNA_END= /DNA_ORIENTATION=